MLRLPPKALLFCREFLRLNCIILLCIAGCSKSVNSSASSKGSSPKSESPVGSFKFVDVTNTTNLKHRFENGEDAGERAILETIGGGVAVIDFDVDGFDDLFFASGGQLNNKAVSGLGCGLRRSRMAQEWVDVTELAGASCSGIYTHGTVAGDLNDDGFPDLLVTGYYGLALLINQGDGTFVDQAKSAGMIDPLWGTSAAFGDFDSDGNLDVYIAHYVNWSFSNHPDCKSSDKPDVCAPGIFTGITDVVWMNQADGSFIRKTIEVGLAQEGKGLGVIATDFTQDSKIDVYVANDTTNNLFYMNTGGMFEEIGLANGTAVDDMGTPQGSMGLCTLDFDSDLKSDIMVSNYENQAFALYKNDGDANFRYATSSSGLMALGTTYVAWGACASDYDLDGDEDVAIANGHVMKANPPEQLPLFLTNLGNSKFQRQDFPNDSYFSQKWRGRGLCAFDMDRDGDLDLVFTHVNQNAVLLSNQTQSEGNWWILKLVGVQSNRDGIGSRVIIEGNQRKLLRTINGGGSYLSQNPYYIHWGLPKGESVKQVTIEWPSGIKQVLSNVPAQTRQTIVEAVN